MTNVLPFNPPKNKEPKKCEACNLEEIIWKNGKFIRKSQISSEKPALLRPEPLGYSKALSGFTPYINEEEISQFILGMINEQELEGRTNAYSMNRRTFGFDDINTLISIQLYHI